MSFIPNFYLILIIILVFLYLFVRLFLINRIEKKMMDGRKIQLSDFLYIIRLKEPAMFWDIRSPDLKPIQVNAGVYELVCIPAWNNTNTYWWKIAGTDTGITPLELKLGLIDKNKAEWLKKPKQREL